MTAPISQNRAPETSQASFEQENAQKKEGITKHPVIDRNKILAYVYTSLAEKRITYWTSIRPEHEWNQLSILEQTVVNLDVNEVGEGKELDKEQKMIDNAIDAQSCFYWAIGGFILGSALTMPFFGLLATCIVGLPLGALFFTIKLAYAEHTKRDPKVKEVDDLRLQRLQAKIQYVQNILQNYDMRIPRDERQALEKIRDVFQKAKQAHENHYAK